ARIAHPVGSTGCARVRCAASRGGERRRSVDRARRPHDRRVFALLEASRRPQVLVKGVSAMRAYVLRTMRPVGVILLFSLIAMTGCLSAAESNSVVQEDRVIAGGPNDSLEVRHLVLRGTNEQFGR